MFVDVNDLLAQNSSLLAQYSIKSVPLIVTEDEERHSDRAAFDFIEDQIAGRGAATSVDAKLDWIIQELSLIKRRLMAADNRQRPVSGMPQPRQDAELDGNIVVSERTGENGAKIRMLEPVKVKKETESYDLAAIMSSRKNFHPADADV